MIAHTEQIIEDLNEAMSLLQKLSPDSKGWQALHIDLEALHAMADENIPIRLERIEQDAQIALYRIEGRHDEAIRLSQRIIQA